MLRQLIGMRRLLLQRMQLRLHVVRCAARSTETLPPLQTCGTGSLFTRSLASSLPRLTARSAAPDAAATVPAAADATDFAAAAVTEPAGAAIIDAAAADGAVIDSGAGAADDGAVTDSAPATVAEPGAATAVDEATVAESAAAAAVDDDAGTATDSATAASAAAVDAGTGEVAAAAAASSSMGVPGSRYHDWRTAWGSFLQTVFAKGHYSADPGLTPDTLDTIPGATKRAVLSLARQRRDILSTLEPAKLKVLVRSGFPIDDRKTKNAHRRLQASLIEGSDLPDAEGGPAEMQDVMRVYISLAGCDQRDADLFKPLIEAAMALLPDIVAAADAEPDPMAATPRYMPQKREGAARAPKPKAPRWEKAPAPWERWDQSPQGTENAAKYGGEKTSYDRPRREGGGRSTGGRSSGGRGRGGSGGFRSAGRGDRPGGGYGGGYQKRQQQQEEGSGGGGYERREPRQEGSGGGGYERREQRSGSPRREGSGGGGYERKQRSWETTPRQEGSGGGGYERREQRSGSPRREGGGGRGGSYEGRQQRSGSPRREGGGGRGYDRQQRSGPPAPRQEGGGGGDLQWWDAPSGK